MQTHPANVAHGFATLAITFPNVASPSSDDECYFPNAVSASGNTTVPSATDDISSRTAENRLVPALVLCWSAEDPSRIGEVAFLDDAVSSTWILGRGASVPEDPAPRAVFVRPRPGRAAVDAGPLTGLAISRVQLQLRFVVGGLEVTTVGKSVLSLDGHPVDIGATRRITPGTVLSIRGHSVYRFVMRPTAFPSGASDVAPFDFGGPDAHGIVGESHAAWALRADIANAARTRGHVFIHGETGTGKELAAYAIHRLLGRRGTIVSFNAATLTNSLAESILFGNVADYPNPNTPERRGLFGEAEGGTLFLDEIGELSVELQARLLRALEGDYVRLGESKPRKADVVVVAATNRDPSALKHDVLKRARAHIRMPTVAERLEDVPLIARALILDTYRKNPDLAERFVLHTADGHTDVNVGSMLAVAMLRASYDGNVRDIRNFLSRAMTDTLEPPLMPPRDLTPWHTPPTMPPPARDVPVADDDVDDLLGGMNPEARRIHDTLERVGWHKQRAAEALGMTRHQLDRLMKKLGVERPK